MDFNCLLCIFQLAETHVKLALSLTCKTIHRGSRKFIQSVPAAIASGDVFSVLQSDWQILTPKQIGRLGSKYMIDAYMKKFPSANPVGIFRGLCYSGNIDLVVETIEHSPSSYLNIGLYIACRSGNADLVMCLIELGANGWNYGLDGACKGNHTDLVLLMITYGSTKLETALVYACRVGDIDLLEFLLGIGARGINQCFSEACKNGQLEVIQILMSRGATYCYTCGLHVSEHL